MNFASKIAFSFRLITDENVIAKLQQQFQAFEASSEIIFGSPTKAKRYTGGSGEAACVVSVSLSPTATRRRNSIFLRQVEGIKPQNTLLSQKQASPCMSSMSHIESLTCHHGVQEFCWRDGTRQAVRYHRRTFWLWKMKSHRLHVCALRCKAANPAQ
jgi:hypothetical protein